jgi:hypothetical protein
VGWDALCVSQGGAPFFRQYLEHQVGPSITAGRHHPDSNPFFYWLPLTRWYGPGLGAAAGALALFWFRRRSWASRWSPDTAILGGLLLAGVALGFSSVTQKYQWYIHAGALGAGLLLGSVLAMVPARFERAMTALALGAAMLWPVTSPRLPHHLTLSQRETFAVQATPGPSEPGQTVADCSPMDAWTSEHLIGFFWRARRVECGAETAWRWDGVHLTERRDRER